MAHNAECYKGVQSGAVNYEVLVILGNLFKFMDGDPVFSVVCRLQCVMYVSHRYDLQCRRRRRSGRVFMHTNDWLQKG